MLRTRAGAKPAAALEARSTAARSIKDCKNATNGGIANRTQITRPSVKMTAGGERYDRAVEQPPPIPAQSRSAAKIDRFHGEQISTARV